MTDIKADNFAVRQESGRPSNAPVGSMTQAATRSDDAPFDAVALYIFTGLAALAAIMATAFSPDPSFRFHGWVMIAGFVTAFLMMSAGMANGRFRADQSRYADGAIRAGVIATMFWAVAGLAAGVVIAAQLSWPTIFYFPDLPWFHFGRLRPVHTSAVVFAFGGNALIGTSCTWCSAPAGAPRRRRLAVVLFWGYQLFIVLAASGYIMGVTQSREYAEPEWYVDLWLTLVWVVYLVIMAGTIVRAHGAAYLRRLVVLHGIHSNDRRAAYCQQPGCSGLFLGTKSYSAFAGVQDAMTQWWYGHNAVGFFLTAGFLGMMYYFLPKQANRPIWSYRLSIINFWALIFLYIWAGPHHLHFTALPEWAQIMGMTFTIMLWMPSWGSAVNGVMTVSGAWDKLRTDPVLRLMVVSVAFYGMSTLEGPADGRFARSTRSATTPTGPSVTSTLAPWAGSPSSASAHSTIWSPDCGDANGCTRSPWSSGTSGSQASGSCSTSPPCGCRASCKA